MSSVKLKINDVRKHSRHLFRCLLFSLLVLSFLAEILYKNKIQKLLIKYSMKQIDEDQTKYEISLIVPIYNKVKYLKDTLWNIVNQTYKEYEIIFVDDCSTDKSYEYVENRTINDRRVTIVRHMYNKGIMHTRRTGVTHARGNYIMNFDPDDHFYGNAIENIMKLIDERRKEFEVNKKQKKAPNLLENKDDNTIKNELANRNESNISNGIKNENKDETKDNTQNEINNEITNEIKNEGKDNNKNDNKTENYNFSNGGYSFEEEDTKDINEKEDRNIDNDHFEFDVMEFRIKGIFGRYVFKNFQPCHQDNIHNTRALFANYTRGTMAYNVLKRVINRKVFLKAFNILSPFYMEKKIMYSEDRVLLLAIFAMTDHFFCSQVLCYRYYYLHNDNSLSGKYQKREQNKIQEFFGNEMNFFAGNNSKLFISMIRRMKMRSDQENDKNNELWNAIMKPNTKENNLYSGNENLETLSEKIKKNITELWKSINELTDRKIKINCTGNPRNRKFIFEENEGNCVVKWAQP